ncbi:MAG: hypothetical protein ABW277_15080 [Longimicrobiaceae bacterium]
MSRVVWLSPSPLWDDLAGGAAFRRPAVLRFASDTFMQDFQAALATEPHRVRGYVARYETWRRPAAGLPPRGTLPAAGAEKLKLYQPVHGRFYLVSASLACRVPGLPEHTVDLAAGETVAFYLRRLTTGAGGVPGELAWVKAGDAQGWTRAGSAAPLADEERLPMFGTCFEADGLTRRLFAGLIPVDRREQYVGGREIAPAGASASNGSSSPSPAAPAGVSTEDPRALEFQRSVLDPWVGLLAWYDAEIASGETARMSVARTAAEQASALILLDLAAFLRAELPKVWDALETPALAAALASFPAQKAFHDAFAFDLWNRTGTGTAPFRQALVDADDSRADLEAQTLATGAAPSFPGGYAAKLLTGDPGVAGLPAATQAAIDADELALRGLLDRDATLPEDAPGVHRRPVVQKLLDALEEWDASTGAGGGGRPDAGTQRPPTLPPLNAQGDDLYVVRCVYARPQCGRQAPPVASDASEPFRLAGFFDADAPQRPVRVALPVDTTPAGLRKYDRNVVFLLSDELRKQMSRVKGMKELMDGEVDNPSGLDISVVCSLSIPIITICALIVLILMVSLLNIVFWWLPFFITCFPVPTLKAKE